MLRRRKAEVARRSRVMNGVDEAEGALLEKASIAGAMQRLRAA